MAEKHDVPSAKTNIEKLVERPVFYKNEFNVLEAVKTNFELEKTSFDIRKLRSCWLTNFWKAIPILKFEASAFLTLQEPNPKSDVSSKTPFRYLDERIPEIQISTIR